MSNGPDRTRLEHALTIAILGEQDEKRPGDEEALVEQIDRLSTFILDEIAGEPSQSEGAVDTAIRLLRAAYVMGGWGQDVETS